MPPYDQLRANVTTSIKPEVHIVYIEINCQINSCQLTLWASSLLSDKLSRRLSIWLHVYVRTSVGFRPIQLKVTCKRCRQLFFVIVDGETMLLKKVLTGSFTFKSIDPCDLSSCTKRCHFIPYPDQRYNLWIKICWISENQSVAYVQLLLRRMAMFF